MKSQLGKMDISAENSTTYVCPVFQKLLNAKPHRSSSLCGIQVRSGSFDWVLEYSMSRDFENARVTVSEPQKEGLAFYKNGTGCLAKWCYSNGQERTSTPAPKRFCFLFLNVRHSDSLLKKKGKLLFKNMCVCVCVCVYIYIYIYIYMLPYWLSR